MYTTNCVMCGSLFSHRFPSVKVCDSCKNRPCEVCGVPFKHAEPYDQHCCSKQCRAKWLENPERKMKIESKKRATLLSRYGVDNIAKLQDVRSKISESRIDLEAYLEKKSQHKNKVAGQSTYLIRNCVICGKQFNAARSQTTCSGPHYRQCVVCGNKFEFSHLSDKRSTCSRTCSAILRKSTISAKEHKCAYCGKVFISESSTAKYCNGPHFKQCEVCGSQFEIDLTQGLSSLPRACSSVCVTKLRERTSMERYGVPYSSQTAEARAESRRHSLETAGQRKATNLARYGVPNCAQNAEIRRKISESISSQKVQSQIKKTTRDRYGVDHCMQSAEFAKKHSRSQFKHTAFDGTEVDSSWEKTVYDFLIRNNVAFEYNNYSIAFEYNGKKHVTYIDFKIGDILLEVKGGHLLEGVYDSKLEVPISVKLDLYRRHNVIIVTDQSAKSLFGKPNSTESNGLKYPNKCPYPLIGVDIDLFRNPSFPFAADKPKCFYKVSVDDSPSSLDAFQTEYIRWKMILNRINYAGGFIDSKQILTAMNVTRTCKQPSWFSKSLALKLISEHCSRDVIVDPFSGWGTRHDAAKELGKIYVGCDLNPELVEWHKSKGRTIELGDANTFTYAGVCSVLICPPYSDPKTGRCFEDYNFEGFNQSAKALSQCDWLKIVMKNIPNANEYVMVCKIVDSGFEKYITETLTNSSHLGKNHEYVIVVKNKDRLQALNTIKELN